MSDGQTTEPPTEGRTPDAAGNGDARTPDTAGNGDGHHDPSGASPGAPTAPARNGESRVGRSLIEEAEPGLDEIEAPATIPDGEGIHDGEGTHDGARIHDDDGTHDGARLDGVRRPHPAPEPSHPVDGWRGVRAKPLDGVPRAQRRAHLVGYAHLDPVWLWRWTEGYAEARATLRSAVDRLDESSDFVHTSTQAVFFDWVRECDPELFAEIAHHVATGRIHLAGGWWVEPDCNIPSGEAFARQALYGQRFCAEHFGLIATVGGNPDSFGHAATLPQILRRAGLDGYFFSRPSPEELELPGEAFRWRSPDGSEVPAYRTHGYSSDRDAIQTHLRRCLEEAGDEREVLVFYGVGNHGGGPTKANLASLRRLAATQRDEILCSTPRAAFDALVAEALPTHEGELQHHGRGCYTSHSELKRLNRRAEEALGEAESWATVASALTGLEYPDADLQRAWKLLLLNQFHDILAGTSIESACEDSRHQLGEVLSTTQRITNAALQRLSTRIRIPHEDDMQPTLVFNPHPWPVRDTVEFEVGGWARRMDLVDDAGEPVPLQWGESEATMREGRYRAVFRAELPPLGYRLYRLRLGPRRVESPPEPAPGRLENEHVLAEVDPETGGLARLLHKASGAELARPGPHAVVLLDPADTWGHEHDSWEDVAGTFSVEHVETVEHGPVRTVVRVASRFRSSTLVEDYCLGPGDEAIEVRVTLDWHERGHMLKLRYPTRVSGEPATADPAADDVAVRASAPYGSVPRVADGHEEPMQGWVDASGRVGGRAAGLTVANDAKYGYDVRVTTSGDGTGASGADVGITAARSVPYAHHDPAVLTPGAAYRWLDLGEQRFRLRLAPHAGDWRAADPARLAAELNRRPLPLRDTYHDGDLEPAGGFAAVEGDGVLGTVVKRAEDGGATIVRLVETAGREATADVRLPFLDRVVSRQLGPFEIVSLRVPDDPEAPVVEVDLLEWTEAERPPGQLGSPVAPSAPATGAG